MTECPKCHHRLRTKENDVSRVRGEFGTLEGEWCPICGGWDYREYNLKNPSV